MKRQLWLVAAAACLALAGVGWALEVGDTPPPLRVRPLNTDDDEYDMSAKYEHYQVYFVKMHEDGTDAEKQDGAELMQMANAAAQAFKDNRPPVGVLVVMVLNLNEEREGHIRKALRDAKVALPVAAMDFHDERLSPWDLSGRRNKVAVVWASKIRKIFNSAAEYREFLNKL